MKIFQLEIGKHSYSEFFAEITDSLQLHHSSQERIEGAVKGKAIFTPNPEICLKTLEDKEFLELLQSADYLTSDGIGLYLAYQISDFHSLCKRKYPKVEGLCQIASFFLFPYFLFNILFRKKYLYKKYGDRICGSDLTEDLVHYASKHNIKIAILDLYNPTDAGKVASQKIFSSKLQAVFPQLDFDFHIYQEDKKEKIFADITTSGAKILFSTLGMKRQELCVLDALASCESLELGLGIGSSFDYHIGYQKRAPKIFRTLGFEWLYRIFTSPNKLQRLGRIFQALVVFPVKVLLYKENKNNDKNV